MQMNAANVFCASEHAHVKKNVPSLYILVALSVVYPHYAIEDDSMDAVKMFVEIINNDKYNTGS